ncbi:uncharacterized protein LOC126263684 [Schistocerca nitens]|uniref:uncharacterized protein LOC126263684 n=1 Tax=Schistocerca nitens TaxID=7011 RepID=UPI002118EB15|nr:uncharacterized protein LOC126263684 [Schistocerca nitens]
MGARVLLDTSVTYEIKTDFDFLNEECSFESSCVDLKDMNTIVISIYRIPGSAVTATFLSKLQYLLTKLKKESRKNIITPADFNVNMADLSQSLLFLRLVP